MAKADFPRIGSRDWCKDMQWGWGIYTVQYTTEGGRSPWEYPEPWVVFNADNRAYRQFPTHAKATAYVRSEIAKQASTA